MTNLYLSLYITFEKVLHDFFLGKYRALRLAIWSIPTLGSV